MFAKRMDCVSQIVRIAQLPVGYRALLNYSDELMASNRPRLDSSRIRVRSTEMMANTNLSPGILALLLDLSFIRKVLIHLGQVQGYFC